MPWNYLAGSKRDISMYRGHMTFNLYSHNAAVGAWVARSSKHRLVVVHIGTMLPWAHLNGDAIFLNLCSLNYVMLELAIRSRMWSVQWKVELIWCLWNFKERSEPSYHPLHALLLMWLLLNLATNGQRWQKIRWKISQFVRFETWCCLFALQAYKWQYWKYSPESTYNFTVTLGDLAVNWGSGKVQKKIRRCSLGFLQ